MTWLITCPCCGGDMIWQSDFSFEDVGREGDGIVSFFCCPKCETDVEVSVPLPNVEYIPPERPDYKEDERNG